MLSYSIAYANGSHTLPLITIGPSNGQISTLPLDYEDVPSHSYMLVVTVTDAGNPMRLATNCTLTLQIRVSLLYTNLGLGACMV